jgi:hypothetical protein
MRDIDERVSQLQADRQRLAGLLADRAGANTGRRERPGERFRERPPAP